MESTTITFLGQVFNREDLSSELVNYIETYNAVIGAPNSKTPDDNDYFFRMSQAMQTFGDQAVIDQIDFLISVSGA